MIEDAQSESERNIYMNHLRVFDSLAPICTPCIPECEDDICDLGDE